VIFLYSEYVFPFSLNLRIQTIGTEQFFVLGFNTDSFVFIHFFDEEFTITNLANLSSGHLNTLWEFASFSPTFSTVGECTKLAVSGFFVRLVLILATITEWVLDRIGNVICMRQIENLVIFFKCELLLVYSGFLGSVIYLDNENLRSLHHLHESSGG
jgi:hypothetical protein